jgi:transposase
METVVERCAGIDIGKKALTACIRIPGSGRRKREQHTRTFSTWTRELAALGDWLATYQVSVVGMESTGAYWKPVYYMLEDQFTCWLVNARHIRNVPGRKTDVKDAEWIAQLVEAGLVRPSLVPPRPIRILRNLTRYRQALTYERTRETQRLEKLLEDAGIKLSSVATDILGASGRAILADLIAGQRDPNRLAEHAQRRLRSKIPRLREALVGHFDEHHAVLAAGMLNRVNEINATIERLNAEIVERLAPHEPQLALLTTIPGIGPRVAEVIVAETGGDMSHFPSAAHLASWAGLCPGNNESAGKHYSGRTRKGSKNLRAALVEGARAAAQSKDTYLHAQYWRIKGRRGEKRAAVAVAHSILVIAYHVLSRGQPYTELGGDYFESRVTAEARARQLVRQLERLGHKVILETREPQPA